MSSLSILATGFLIMFVGSGARFAFGLTLKPMAEEFGLGRGMLGTTVAVYFVATAAFMFLSGRMIDRYEPRAVLAWGLVISAVGIGLVGWATTPWHLFVLYGLVFGVGNGIASITPVSIMVTRLYSRARRRCQRHHQRGNERRAAVHDRGDVGRAGRHRLALDLRLARARASAVAATSALNPEWCRRWRNSAWRPPGH